jgi:hypothetical protein
VSKFKRPVANLGIRYPVEGPKGKPMRMLRNGIGIVTVGLSSEFARLNWPTSLI